MQQFARQVTVNWALWFLKRRAPGSFWIIEYNLENQVLRFLYLNMWLTVLTPSPKRKFQWSFLNLEKSSLVLVISCCTIIIFHVNPSLHFRALGALYELMQNEKFKAPTQVVTELRSLLWACSQNQVFRFSEPSVQIHFHWTTGSSWWCCRAGGTNVFLLHGHG